MGCAKYDTGPEVTNGTRPEAQENHFPEVVHASQPTQQSEQQYGFWKQPYKVSQSVGQQEQQQSYQYMQRPGGMSPASGYTLPPSSTSITARSQAVPSTEPAKKTTTKMCGCSILVFVLSSIIALLSAAVIGLAAGTGIEAIRANNANNQLTVLRAQLASATSVIATATRTSATMTAVAASATATAFSQVDAGCSTDTQAVNGSTYTAFDLLGRIQFTRRCYADTNGIVLYSLFTSNFDMCLDACSGYTVYLPRLFANNESATTCHGVSFIPLWTFPANASAGGAPGNCYLKSNNEADNFFREANIGTDCHAAVMTNP